MASSKDYLNFILEQLSGLDDISYCTMMGEYIIYYRGKIVGGIYDDRFLVKPVKAAIAKMPEAALERPYEGAKEMLLVDDVDNRDFLREYWMKCMMIFRHRKRKNKLIDWITRRKEA